MATRIHNPYEAPEPSANKRRLLDVFLLSLLAHAVLIAILLLLAAFMPLPEPMQHKPEPPEEIILSVMPPPPKKPIFIPTQPQQNVKHVQQPVESANDTELQSKSTTARAPDSIMPDVNGQPHETSLNNSPNVQTPPTPQVSSTPPTPKETKPDKPTPPHPTLAQTAPTPIQPPQPTPPKPVPPKPKPPVKPQPLVDENGLPVLPPINAPTLAPPDSAAPPTAPPPSLPQVATSVHGALGRAGDNSPAAMATELGKYKQYVYSVVGSYWYPDINQHFGTIGVGLVHIQFTIHSDGKITDVTILEGNNLMILRDISHNALIAPAPYKPFSDAMIKEVGDSFTDDFTFSVY